MIAQQCILKNLIIIENDLDKLFGPGMLDWLSQKSLFMHRFPSIRVEFIK